MKRREFITFLSGAAIAWPLAARAQQKRWRIGYIEGGSPSTRPLLIAAFKQKLKDLGYSEEQYVIDAKYAEGRDDRLPGLASELIEARPDVILAIAPQPAFAVAKTSKSVPIVFLGVGDPVNIGLVASLANPGGNVTGLSVVAVELTGKRLELLKELVPNTSRIGVIYNPGSGVNLLELKEVNVTAAKLGINALPVEVSTVSDFSPAFQTFRERGADAVFVMSSPLVFPNQRPIADLAIQNKLPTTCALREYTMAGCMVSYGPSYIEHFRKAAVIVDRILKGTKPGDIPVEQPTQYELIVNLRTANSIGVNIPEAFLLRANEVIE